jgi:hypothetical protein
VIGRTVEALTVILVPMLVFENYFIYPGLAELWWILAGLLFAGTTRLAQDRAEIRGGNPAVTRRFSGV